MREQATQLFIRKEVDQGETISVLVQRGDAGIELNMSPKEALDFARTLVNNARLSQFGRFQALQPGEVVHKSPYRALDMVVLTIGEVIEDLREQGAAPTWPSTPSGAIN